MRWLEHCKWSSVKYSVLLSVVEGDDGSVVDCDDVKATTAVSSIQVWLVMSVMVMTMNVLLQ